MTDKTASLLTSHSTPETSSSLGPRSWLITGGCGFIGRNLIKNLVDQGGHYIRVLDNLSVGTREDLAQVCQFTDLDSSPETSSSPLTPDYSLPTSSCTIELIVGDILDPDLALKASRGIDVIVHLAANTGVGPSVENPRKDCETNIIGTFNMLEAARHNNVMRFIFASSGAPVGECEPPIHEELAPHPVSPYGASKLAGEGYCSAYFRTFGVETVALRFGNVYGPLSGNKDSIVAKFIRQAKNGKICEVYGDGMQTRDFIFVDDLIKAILVACVQDVGGEIFQIATNREHTINEVAQIIKTQLEKTYRLNMQLMHVQPRVGDVKRNYSETSKARYLLGWEGKVELNEGIKRTVAWFMNRQTF